MGVPKFYGEYISKTNAVKSRYNGTISSLSVDMNGIIHSCAQKVFHYTGKDTNEDIQRRNEDLYKDINILNQQCYDMVTNTLMDHVKKLKPKSLILAIDGPAPLGKIKQQRIRRYMNAPDPTMRFTSASISPGTNFMIGLDSHIQLWIKRSRKDLPKNLVYSSHLVPGEGEHKIMELMRNDNDAVYLNNGGLHILMGDDADLMFLSLLSPLKNIWVSRGRDYVDIGQLSRDILSRGINVQDFTVIAFLLGNDFLPHIVSLNEVMTTLDNAIQAYKNNGMPLVINGKLDREAFKALVSLMAKSEPFWLKDIAMDPGVIAIRALESSKTMTQYGYHTDVEVDYNAFYSNWYTYGLSPKKDSKIKSFDIMEYHSEVVSIASDMATSYLNTIEWVFNYYTTGINDISLTWYYPYDFAPLLADIAVGEFTEDHLVISDPVHKFFHPLQQLFMILGPQHSAIIPFSLGSMMTSPNSPLIDLYPIHVKTSREGYKTDWQLDVYLPELDPNRIVSHIVPSKIKGIEKLFPYETRNLVSKI